MIDRTKMTKFRDKGHLWQILLLFVAVAISTGESYLTDNDFLCTFEKPICRWRWNTTIDNGFEMMSGEEATKRFNETGKYTGPPTDSDNLTRGHYMNLLVTSSMGEVHVWSSKLSQTLRRCKLRVWLSMMNMTNGKITIIADSSIPWVVAEAPGNNNSKWEMFEFLVGRIQQEFRIIIAIDFAGHYPAQAALDHISLFGCFPEVKKPGFCTTEYFSCSDSGLDFCLNRTQLCDIRIDCINGIDEEQGCDAVPEVGRCNFDTSWCGWQNSENTAANWTRMVGVPDYNRITGPAFDSTLKNKTGMFLYANMSDPDLPLGAMALLESSIINPPPRYHSRPESPYFLTCNVRFFYHQYGRASGSFALFLIEHHPFGDRSRRLFYTFGDKGDTWVRNVVIIPPNISYPYQLQFEVRRGIRSGGDVAVDDVSMSRECFGLNVPEKEKEGYNYDTFKGFATPTVPTETHADFVNQTVYIFTTCGATGRSGPTQENCTKAYNNTNVTVTVVDDPPISGVQKWVVPARNFYTIIAKGAAGGTGSDGYGSSRGATAVGIIELLDGQELYMLVGQEGNGGCRRNFAMTQHHSCGRIIPPKPTPPGPRFSPPRSQLPSRKSSNPFKELRKLILQHSGGGGGGGTFVYTIGPDGRVPLIVGGGGGGLGGGRPNGETMQDGKGIDPTRLGITGLEYGSNPPGAGGGWNTTKNTSREVTGGALIHGALGGLGCGTPKGYHGMGGFGGGGGGCTSGGGGGGYSGGSASGHWKNGRGGYSYVDLSMQQREVIPGHNGGPGAVIIIPALTGCGCEYLCAAVDENLEHVKCVCPAGWSISPNLWSCDGEQSTRRDPNKIRLVISDELVFAFLGTLGLTILCIAGHIGYKCYARAAKQRRVRRAVVEQESSTDIQLHRLRHASENIMTEQNPTYEVAGPTLTASHRDLPAIPRESLRFSGALGQGAFGEVYQGYYRLLPDQPDMPVAIKTLPAFSSPEAESDFFMEALIMSKFNHPNIVGFIGVCFERHPRFIVLELLAGGDLKNFLRENRPHAGDPNRLTMRDLLKFARDVAQGCAYLEERRFIHRDIAARNCLLTSKGPDKTVKIADFGMAKDIYRSDYYRKAGRAMLPVKWMPPEAFQDGVFTTKTDIWSYGVLLWEVMSIGFMPYTGCGNREVMQFVVRGGRLEPPRNCPGEVYAIMKLCWQRMPDERPTFTYVLERIGYCLQDPVILSTRLPLFVKSAKGKRKKKGRRKYRVRDGEGSARLDTDDDDFDDDDDDDVIADEDEPDEDDDADALAAAIAASQETQAEAEKAEKAEEEEEPQPGTSKSALGKNSNSDSLETVFVVPPEPSTKKDPQPGISGWSKRGKSKSFDFGRRRSLSDAVTLDPAALAQEMPVISATRGPLGPKGRLKPSEIIKYRMHIETVGKDDNDDLDSVASDEEETTYC